MDYSELKTIFLELKRTSPRENLTAHVVFTEDSFDKPYPLLSRTYRISSDNKAFWPNMGGYSIFASCLDGTDQGVRLDWLMAAEGNPGGWKVEECYILEMMRDVEEICDLTRIELEDARSVTASAVAAPVSGFAKPLRTEKSGWSRWLETR